MGLDNFRKNCELLKETNNVELITSLKENLGLKPDEERKNIFNEVFAKAPPKEEPKEKPKKEKK